jgi:hypothetical protein
MALPNATVIVLSLFLGILGCCNVVLLGLLDTDQLRESAGASVDTESRQTPDSDPQRPRHKPHNAGDAIAEAGVRSERGGNWLVTERTHPESTKGWSDDFRAPSGVPSSLFNHPNPQSSMSLVRRVFPHAGGRTESLSE